MPRSYPPELRRKVFDLVESGRPIKQVAELLGVTDQTIHAWRKQHLVDTGRAPRIPSGENAELVAARKRIAELEAELAVHRRAAELLDAVVLQKALRSGRGDGRRRPARPGRHARVAGLRVRVLRAALAHPLGPLIAPRLADRADHRGPRRLPRRLRRPARACRAHPRPWDNRLARGGRAADAARRPQRPRRDRRRRPRPEVPTATDLVKREFARAARDRLWVTDITEHPAREGKVYCAVVLDAFSRRVVGWSIDATQTAALVTNPLSMAIQDRSGTPARAS